MAPSATAKAKTRAASTNGVKKATSTRKAVASTKPIAKNIDQAKTAATKKAPVTETKRAKRKIANHEDPQEQDAIEIEGNAEPSRQRPTKKARTAASSAPRAAPARAAAIGRPINQIPDRRLDVFVCGEGSSGELGLGSKPGPDGVKPIDVKRPHLNHLLSAETVGVVQIACGGMHAIALTHDNKILTWGVNDDNALGRDTNWDGGVRDIDDEEDQEDEDDTGVNPGESTPGPVNMSAFPEGTRIAQVAASDSASFALTEDGHVYGWGTFRGGDGIIGFSPTVRNQATPVVVPGLTKITRLACGSNHVLALDIDGKVFAWGSGGQSQLGRKQLSRHGSTKTVVQPQPCGRFTKRQHAVDIAAGSYHSFWLDNHGKVWSFGLNNYCQTGHSESSGEDDAMIVSPQMVESLEDFTVTNITGGEHHSVACTDDGRLLTWGRVDGHQVGQPPEAYTEDNTTYDESGRPRILRVPTQIAGIDADFAVAGTDNSFVIDKAGKAFAWGFSANYQTGLRTEDDVETPTLVIGRQVRDRKFVSAGAGGQFSILTSLHGDQGRLSNEEEANGTQQPRASATSAS